jgi:hypothetical protein
MTASSTRGASPTPPGRLEIDQPPGADHRKRTREMTASNPKLLIPSPHSMPDTPADVIDAEQRP